MALDPAMAALAARTAARWRAEQECPRCGDEHAKCAPTCVYCSAEATVSSAIGLDGDYSEPNEIGQRQYIAPRNEPRCDECQAGFERSARRAKRLAEMGAI